MAWYVDFKSLKGKSYRVLIGDVGGSMTPLTPADEPFVTLEDSGGDLFTPVRIQSGYVRVHTNDVNLMEDIIPQNNTTTKVNLILDGSTIWSGYLQANGYSQPWEGGTNLIELPVKSVLGSLYDSVIDQSFKGQLTSFSDIIQSALASIGYSYYYVSVNDDCSGDWLSAKVNASVFFKETAIQNEGESEVAYFGMTYGEIIEDICTLFGLMCRDTGSGLLFSVYDKPSGFPIGIITSVFNFFATGHQQNFMQGYKRVTVRLSLDDTSEQILTLPGATEDDSTVYTVDKVANGTVNVQPHYRNDSNIETFYYRHYTGLHAPTYTNYDECLNRSVVFTPIVPPATVDPTFVTGAFPVRYSFNPDGDNTFKILRNGIMINTRRLTDYDDAMPDNIASCYEIRSDREYSFSDGYLNLQIAMSNFWEDDAGYERRKTNYGMTGHTYPRKYRLRFMLRWGIYYWDGTQWSDNISTFDAVTNGESLITNLGEDIRSLDSSGLFFPIKSEMEGIIELTIMNFGAFRVTFPDETTGTRTVNSSIISKLDIYYHASVGGTVSDRRENVYSRDVIASGFSEEKESVIHLGTMNNNIPSKKFIKWDSSTYIDTFYYTSNGRYERPETHLLGRMETYYGQTRRTMLATVEAGLDLFGTLYSHNDHVFVGIDAQHHWRDDTQVIAFIEVKN